MENTEKKLKNFVEPIFDIEDPYQNITKKIDFTDKIKKDKPMNVFLVPGIVGASVAAIAIASFMIFPAPSKPKAMVSIDVNPSIQLIIDTNNIVTSVNGGNDEGKMIILGEEIVGKDLESAIEIIINEENETGYLLDGNVSVDENKITITVSCDTERLQNEIEEAVTTYVNDVCDKLDIAATTIVNEIENAREQIEAKIMEYDLAQTIDTLKNLSYAELLEIVNGAYNETSEIVSVGLEALYHEAKNNDIVFAETEFVQDAISQVNTIYQFLLGEYNKICETLEKYSSDLEQMQYDLLVDPESDYQKKLQECNAAKDELIKLRNELAKEENPDFLENASLQAKQAALDALLMALNGFEQIANGSITTAKNLVDTAINALRAFEATFPSEVKTILNEKAKELETSVNELKDTFFEKFEEEYKDDLLRFKEEALQRKEALKNTNK